MIPDAAQAWQAFLSDDRGLLKHCCSAWTNILALLALSLLSAAHNKLTIAELVQLSTMYINVMTAIYAVSPTTLFLIEGGGQLGLSGSPSTTYLLASASVQLSMQLP